MKEPYKMMTKYWVCRQIISAKLVLVTVLLLSACQMPSYNSPTAPSSSSGSSGSSTPSEPAASSDSSGAEETAQPSSSDGSSADTSQGAPSAGAPDNSTAGESIEDLDQTLDESLEGFDNSVGDSLEAAEVIDILSPSGSSEIQSDSTEPSSEKSLEATVVEENTDIAQRASSESDSAQAGESPAENSNANSDNPSAQGQTGESIPIPEDIEESRGDNIVQRQIREAAMQETDPVLRDRLWDEYRKMKNL